LNPATARHEGRRSNRFGSRLVGAPRTRGLNRSKSLWRGT